ncbi:MAG: hypothetical protein DHS20C05_00430 [Hyphococcus sp.]|nr:MAG: hypothetical protein DHS20C05_00430 [Marinicaulis sp.]
MSPVKKKDINLWTGRFASEKIESAFGDFVFSRNLAANVGGASLGLFLFVIYVFSDYIDAVNPNEVVAIRVVTFVIGAALMSLLLIKRFRPFHDPISAAVLILMGAAINLIVYTQPSLENTYYIALIQGFIMFSLFLRLSFISMVVVIASTQVTFVIAAFAHPDISNAVLQSINLLLVGVVCAIGVYLMQRYQRVDFLKSQTIQTQNAKLNILLDDAKRDNERKLAAMNMLVHFVKTPLHQINGFSDIVMNSLDVEEERISINDGVEGARYIKNATANLSKSVNNLLNYHRLDDVDGAQNFEDAPIDEMIYDFKEMLPVEMSVKTNGKAGMIRTDCSVFKTALDSLVNHYSEQSDNVSVLSIELEQNAGAVEITLRDDGPAIDNERFLQETKPLTKIDNYLTSDGAEMSMFLRTVARAVEICGGTFSWAPCDAGNCFIIRLSGEKSDGLRLVEEVAA